MTIEETIGTLLEAKLAPLRNEIGRLAAEVEALRHAVPPALVPVREAAEALGVSEATVRRRIRDGDMAMVRIGRSVRVDLAALRPAAPAEVVRLAAAIRSR